MQYIRQFLESCTISVLEARRIRCWPDWQEMNYIPSYNKFYFILSGEGELTVDGKIYHPQPGELFLMPAGVRQSYRTINENTYTKYWCHFTAESGGVRLFDAVKTPLCVRPSHPEQLTRLFADLAEAHASQSPYAPLAEKARMLEILLLFLEEAEKLGISYAESVPAEQLKQITDYISAHLAEEITLEDLAGLVHFHPNYFISFFRKYFGMPPLRYVSTARLERAKLLLKTTPDSIASVAEQTGFHGVYHFSKRFKNYTGFSPSDFRKL
ncbi:MAG: AraC family transcriptional regulator [Candidatus Merdivicinus sp.]|jgi:AraC family transcriptional regulator of arabinose operon